MPHSPLTRHVPKEDWDALVVYAEDNYSTIFEPLPGQQPEPDGTEKVADPGELEPSKQPA